MLNKHEDKNLKSVVDMLPITTVIGKAEEDGDRGLSLLAGQANLTKTKGVAC